jgi:glycosyltransferase involved in cell wall biosynthesis
VIYRSIGDLTMWSADRVRRWRTGALLGRVAVVVVLAERAGAAVVQLGVAEKRVVVITNGVPEASYPFVTEDVRSQRRAEHGLANAPVVAFVGALEPEKGVDTAIRAVSATHELQLLIAGDGSERVRLERLAQEVAPGRVYFLGRVPSSAPVLAAADVLVLPSLTEGVPAVAIEAGLTGIPTVASAVGFVDEVVLDGVTGLLRPPGDVPAFASALSRAVAHRDELGVAARMRCIQRFSMDAIAASWAALIRDCATN